MFDKSDHFPNTHELSAKHRDSEVLTGQYTEHVLDVAHAGGEFIRLGK